MVFHRLLDEVLGQRSKVSLLRLLIRLRGAHTGRDLARYSGLDHKTCHAALRALAAQGVVTHHRQGTAVVFALRTDHPIVHDILIPAFEAEGKLLRRFAEETRRLVVEPLESVILFGSVARTEERPNSDVDLLFVTADGKTRGRVKRRLDHAAVEMAARWGNVPQILVEDRETLQRHVQRGSLFHLEVLSIGQVLHGKRVAELMRDVA